MSQKELVHGLVTLTGLVAGNIIGSGIYLVPATLAADVGPAALLAWIAVGIGIGYFPLTLAVGMAPAVIAGSPSPLAAAARGVLGPWGEPARFVPAALRRGRISAGAGFAVALVMIAGTGWEVIAGTAVLALVPVPYYLARRRRHTAGEPP